MKVVRWRVDGTTYVNTDDREAAIEDVMKLLDERPWGETGMCSATFENMAILTVTDAGIDSAPAS